MPSWFTNGQSNGNVSDDDVLRLLLRIICVESKERTPQEVQRFLREDNDAFVSETGINRLRQVIDDIHRSGMPYSARYAERLLSLLEHMRTATPTDLAAAFAVEFRSDPPAEQVIEASMAFMPETIDRLASTFEEHREVLLSDLFLSSCWQNMASPESRSYDRLEQAVRWQARRGTILLNMVRARGTERTWQYVGEVAAALTAYLNARTWDDLHAVLQERQEILVTPLAAALLQCQYDISFMRPREASAHRLTYVVKPYVGLLSASVEDGVPTAWEALHSGQLGGVTTAAMEQAFRSGETRGLV